MSQPLTFTQIYLKTVSLTQILGGRLYNFDIKTKKIYLLKWAFLQIIIYSITYFTLSYFYWEKTDSTQFYKKSSKAINFLVIFNRHSYSFGMILSIFSTIVYQKGVFQLFIKMDELDNKLTKLNPYFANRSNAKIRNFGIWSQIIGIVFLHIVYEFFINGFKIATFITIYEQITLMNKKILFTSYTLFFRERFKLINRVFGDEIQKSKRINKFPGNCNRFNKRIHQIVELHQQLQEICWAMNDKFSIQTLYIYAIDFIAIVANGYFLIYVVMSDEARKYDHFMLIIIILNKTAMQALMEMVFVSNLASEVVIEAQTTKKLLVGINVHPDKEETRNFVKNTTTFYIKFNHLFSDYFISAKIDEKQNGNYSL